MAMIRFSTENLNRVFEKPGNDPAAFKKLLFNKAMHKDCYGENGLLSDDVTNAKITRVTCDILGLDENKQYSRRDFRRAWKKRGIEVLEVWEDVIDFKVSTGFDENEFFNEFVEKLNIKEHDRQDFYVRKDAILTVASISGGHHDLTTQKLTKGRTITIPMHTYGMEVGQDIDLFTSGRKDWSEFPDAVARAFVQKFQNLIYEAFAGAAEAFPAKSQFKKTGELTKEHKNDFDTLLEDVSIANDGAEVVIVGLHSDLQKLTALADVNWAGESQKQQINSLGRLGEYETYRIIEIKNGFVEGDVTKKLIQPGTLYILPSGDNKFVKAIDGGETYIDEITEKGDTNADLRLYEIQREFGVGVVIDKYHGEYHITG